MLMLMEGLIPLAAVLLGGCATTSPVNPPSVAAAWKERDGAPPVSSPRPPSATAGARTPEFTEDSASIATVNGRPIARSRIADLLMQSHGAGLLEQVVALYAAEDLAAAKGVTVTESDVDREFELALQRLVNPVAPTRSGSFDRAVAERLLESVLSERNISGEEFLIPVRRNAYLRKIAQTDLTLTDAQLRTEYDRRYGERVQVRHIQLTSAAEAARMQERLVLGEGFAELANRYSANTGSAADGGLLDPISASDDEIPENFRRTAFALRPGQISGVVRVGEWHHVLKLERRIPAENPDFQSVRDQLSVGVRERLADQRMRELYEKLLGQAAVDIHDPALRAAYQRRQSQRTP